MNIRPRFRTARRSVQLHGNLPTTIRGRMLKVATLLSVYFIFSIFVGLVSYGTLIQITPDQLVSAR